MRDDQAFGPLNKLKLCLKSVWAEIDAIYDQVSLFLAALQVGASIAGAFCINVPS